MLTKSSLRQKVITLHGVNPDPWQDSVHRILEPHFECVKLGYHDYDGLRGPFRVFCHPLALIGALGALLGSMGAAFTARWDLVSALLIALPILVVGGALVAAMQRRACTKRIKAHIGRVCASPPWPHVIAHSFGTYIVGQALKHPDVSIDRVALVGSVLPRYFAWDRLLEHDRPAFSEVRNETGTRDWVVWIARWARCLAWDVGDAGRRGFQVRKDVHQTGGPWAACETCITPSPEGLVHNVPLGELEHSDAFLGPGHAQRLWLPFLWGIPPGEFDAYVSMCWDAAVYLQDGFTWQFEISMEELAASRWSWTSDSPLAEFAAKVLRHELALRGTLDALRDAGRLDELVWAMLSRVCHYTVAAYDGSAEDRVRLALHPLRALVRAARATAEELI